MKLLDAFFMAWSMFLAIPCPHPVWREDARGKMLLFFPAIGLIVGFLWALCTLLLRALCVPAPFASLVLAALPWCSTGLMHLDGFMDVCDALLSHRPLAERQRILKDPHCGSFAVIAMILLAAAQWALFASAQDINIICLLLLPPAVRCAAALCVRNLPAMEQSQYAHQSAQPRIEKVALLLTLLVLVLFGVGRGAAGFAPLAAAIGYGCFALAASHALGGMSGDVSGFALTLAELIGVAIICLGG